MSDDLDDWIASLAVDAENEQIVLEIGALRSIYGDECLTVWHPHVHSHEKKLDTGCDERTVRFEVYLDLNPPHDSQEARLKVLVTLRASYPASTPPQLQLLSRYIGSFSVDSNLFGSVLRTYISSNGVEWQPGSECVFDGLENVRDLCTKWYSERLSEGKVQEIIREEEKERTDGRPVSETPSDPVAAHRPIAPQALQASLPEGVKITVAEPITDRKSVFVGRACAISNPLQVPLILSYLTADKRIARAAHPVINAWRCKVDSVLHQDNDDDGETAAGGRLAHLLQILDVNNVLVVVTRYFGGIHLGPDRFKHINQAARNALEDGGFLEAPNEKKNVARGKKKG